MDMEWTGFDRAEALRYLGWWGGPVPADMAAMVDRCQALLAEHVRPRTVWRLFDITADGTLAGTAFRPAGEDIRKHLEGCRQVVLMGATLGAGSEALLRRTQSADMALALVLDACAGAAIERVCDGLCEAIGAKLAPKYLTDRFSPGYGDMPLAQQTELCRVLDLDRRIGVTLTAGGLMLPQKSVTALIGVSDRPCPSRRRACEGCERYDTCALRKEGGHCGK